MIAADLQDLRHALRPAFLWDAARRRVVWANAAAVQFFGAQGLTDLVERPFDAREAGVRALQQAYDELQRGNTDELRLQLHFPSTGRDEPLTVAVRRHLLADGRPGLLAVAAEPAVATARPRVLGEILQEMPLPVLAVTSAGEPLLVNRAALELLDETRQGALAGLFPSQAAAVEFLQRAREAGTAVTTRQVATRIGRRTLRITARTTSEGDLIVITLDDLTDRLQAERGMMPAVAGLCETVEATGPEGQAPESFAEQEESPPAREESPATGLHPQELATLRRIMEALESSPEAAAEPAGQESEEEPQPAATATPAASEDAAEQEKAAASAQEERQPSAAQAEAPARPRISIRVTRPKAPGEAPGQAGQKEEAPAKAAAEEEAAVAREHVDAPAPSHTDEEVSEAAPSASAAAGHAPAMPEPALPPHSPREEERQEGGPVEEEAETAQGAAQEETEEVVQAAEEAAPPRPQPPQLVRDVLDHRPEPIILHRADAFYFANAAAREMFGFALEDAAWDAMARTLTDAHDGDELQLPDAAGRMLRFRLKRDVFPWRAGVVVQSTLQPLGEAVAREKEQASSSSSASGHPSSSGGESRAAAGAPRAAAAHRAPAPVIRIHADHGAQQEDSRETTNAPASASSPVSAAAASALSTATSGALARELDAELRAMLETAADGIVTLNARGRILSFSSGAEQLFGYRGDEVVGRLFRELLAEESRPTLDACLARLLQDPAARQRHECGRDRGREVLGLSRDGEKIPLYLTMGLLHHELPRDSDHRASFCVVVHDISSFKRRESELRRAKEEAEELSARKSEFLARISHELRTPLNAILGFSDVLRQELYGHLGNDKYRDYARDIYDSGEHLLALVNDLLDLARIEAGRYELDMKEVDLAAVVEETVNLMRDQIGKAGITLRRVVPEGLPRVVADARSIKQILLNLLSNAVKFSRRGDQVVVALRQRPDGGLELVVKDTGPGMSEEELKAALEPFRRVPRTGRDKPGTGLGLPLAKALTEANRARFEIDTQPGKGTEVRIIFPPHRVLA